MAQDRFVWDATAVARGAGRGRRRAVDLGARARPPAPDRRGPRPGPGPAGPRMLLRRASRPGPAAGPRPGRRHPARPGAGRRGRACACACAAAGVCIWRGVWLEEGVRAAGVVAPETQFAASDQDALTGLLDRKSFIARGRASSCRRPARYELIVADLDRLRRLNEALGHERADLVLAALGSRLAAAFPPDALLARIGEDEFAAPGAAGVGARRRAPARARWSSRCASPASTSTRPSPSAPCAAEGGADAPEAAELLRRAELAVEVGQEPRPRRRGRLRPRPGERRPLAPGAGSATCAAPWAAARSMPFYQPIVRLSTGALSGFEALVRWRHPRRGLRAARRVPAAVRRDGPDGRAGRHDDARPRPGSWPQWRERAPGRRRADRQRQPLHRRDRPRRTWSTTWPHPARRPACRRAR